MQLTDEQIEKLRQSGVRLDADGRFWHEGGEVSHVGMRAAFFRWLDRNPDGRYVLRLDERRFVYLDVDDAPYSIRSLRWEGARALVRVSDDAEEELDYQSLRMVGDVAYCTVRRKDKSFDARLSNAAFSALTEHVRQDDGHFVVEVGAREFPLK